MWKFQAFSATQILLKMKFGEISGGGNGEFNSYQNGGDIPDFNSSEFKREKEDFFGRIQRENANRRE